MPLDRAGRVIVEPDLSVPGHPEIFVAGDLALVHASDGQAAAGRGAGRQAAGHARRAEHPAPDPRRSRPRRSAIAIPGNMATIGRADAIADFGWARVSGFLGWLMWLFVHILFLIGFRNRLSVLLQWAASYLTYQRSVRLITGAGARRDA